MYSKSDREDRRGDGALTGVSVALLTVYDMCKAIDKSMEIGEIYLCHKSGGKSGEIRNEKIDGQKARPCQTREVRGELNSLTNKRLFAIIILLHIRNGGTDEDRRSK